MALQTINSENIFRNIYDPASQSIAVNVVTGGPSGGSTAANQTNGSQKTQIVDGSGNVIGSSNNSLKTILTGGNLVPDRYDDIVITYVGATTRIATVVYKLATVIIATLTLTYDGSSRLIEVARS